MVMSVLNSRPETFDLNQPPDRSFPIQYGLVAGPATKYLALELVEMYYIGILILPTSLSKRYCYKVDQLPVDSQ